MNFNSQRAKYIVSDYVAALVSWFLFYSFRKFFIESEKFGYPIPIEFGQSFFLGILFIPLLWVLLYYITGYYKEVYRKSRLLELGYTVISTLSGVIIIFFFLILDDTILSHRSYYHSFLFLFPVHFTLTYLLRLGITSHTKRLARKGKVYFNTLLIGSDQKALEIFREINSKNKLEGNKFVGYITINGNRSCFSDNVLKNLGHIDNTDEVIKTFGVQEVIIALETTEHDKFEKIINKLYYPGITIKAIPGMFDILTNRVTVTSIMNSPLIQINQALIPSWQENFKHLFDLSFALLALIITLPISIIIALLIKITSKGPVIYSQERIGLYGKPFRIYKFRSMVVDAEKDGPRLSSANDRRITSLGRLLRRNKIDELPNFVNVLMGNMSIVGPRPERQFYINQIILKAPYYAHLFKVKPGITSWGQVKYGYAHNVEQMVERLKFDLIYLDNMSLFIDFKIIIYTILILFKGRNI